MRLVSQYCAVALISMLAACGAPAPAPSANQDEQKQRPITSEPVVATYGDILQTPNAYIGQLVEFRAAPGFGFDMVPGQRPMSYSGNRYITSPTGESINIEEELGADPRLPMGSYTWFNIGSGGGAAFPPQPIIIEGQVRITPGAAQRSMADREFFMRPKSVVGRLAEVREITMKVAGTSQTFRAPVLFEVFIDVG